MFLSSADRSRIPSNFMKTSSVLFASRDLDHLNSMEPEPDNLPKKTEINPGDNHISFQCDSMQVVVGKLQKLKIKYVKPNVEDGGIYVDQLFIHDPDGFVLEICNCENFLLEPIMGFCPACVRWPSHMLMSTPIFGRIEAKNMQSIVAKKMAQQLVMDGSSGHDEFAMQY